MSWHLSYINLSIVFFLTGIWHGASWNFVIWGMFHGFFLASEHAGFSNILDKAWKPVQHLYVILIIIVAWVFFRADTLAQAMDYFSAMTKIANWHTTAFQYAQVIPNGFVYVFIAGLIFSLPVYPSLTRHIKSFCGNSVARVSFLVYIPRLAILSALLILSILKVASSTYNPFIYFRF